MIIGDVIYKKNNGIVSDELTNGKGYEIVGMNTILEEGDMIGVINNAGEKLYYHVSHFTTEKPKIRGFEEVDGKHGKHSIVTVLPKRATKNSAGYDFRIKEELVIEPNQRVITMSDVKSYMQEGEVLKLYPRSSMGIKRGLRISNGTGIIDMDYYSNPKNDGNIGIAIHNFGDTTQVLKVGERVCQGIFVPFLVADDDDADTERVGGIGHTGK